MGTSSLLGTQGVPTKPAGSERDDEDPDLSFMDEAQAPDPMEDERAEAGDDPTDNEMAAPRPPPAREPKVPPAIRAARPKRRTG